MRSKIKNQIIYVFLEIPSNLDNEGVIEEFYLDAQEKSQNQIYEHFSTFTDIRTFYHGRLKNQF